MLRAERGLLSPLQGAVLGVALAAALATPSCSKLTCGPGTRESGGQCLPALDTDLDAGSSESSLDGGPDSGTVDAATTDSGYDAGLPDTGPDASRPDIGPVDWDAGTQDAGYDPTNDRWGSFDIVVEDLIPKPSRVPTIPIGGAMSCYVCGSDASGRCWPVQGATFSVYPESAAPIVRAAPRGGKLYLVGLRAGRALVRATVLTGLGPRVSELLVDVSDSYFDGTLDVASIPDDPITLTNIAAPDGGTSVPLDLAARVQAWLRWKFRYENGSEITAYAEAHPEDLRITVISGNATVDATGRVHGEALGDVAVAVSFAPLGTNIEAPSANTAFHFIGELPASGLVAASGRDSEGTLFARSARAANAPDPTGLIPELGSITLDSDLPPPRIYIGIEHGGGTVSYRRWQSFETLSTRASGDAAAFTIDASGVFRWAHAGVALWTASAGGYSLPVLVAARYGSTTRSTLRADPASLSFTLATYGHPSCQKIKLYLSDEGAPERALTDLEALAVLRNPHAVQGEPYDSDVIRDTPTPLHFCAPTARYSGVSSPARGSVDVSFLRGWFQPLVNVPFTVTF